MRANQARTIAIAEYLQSVEGIQPAHSRMGGRELWYRSPLRQWDSTPSFKVDTVLNLWHDHGISQGGNTLDLVCAIRNASVKQALAVLRQSGLYRGGVSTRSAPSRGSGSSLFSKGSMSASAQQWIKVAASSASPASKSDGLAKHRILSVEPLTNPALLNYITRRWINADIAKQHLEQVEFSPADKLASYFALGWPNGEGFEVRNKYFKGFVGEGKSISVINLEPDGDVLLFEGFMDYLSYLTVLRQQQGIDKPKAWVIVLNSTSLRARALAVLSQCDFSKLFCFLDNDEAGRSSLDYFQVGLPDSVIIDKSDIYAGFKDFNALLCDQTTSKTSKNA